MVRTVFVLMAEYGYGYADFEGVFETEDAAEERIDKLCESGYDRHNYKITEEEVQS